MWHMEGTKGEVIIYLKIYKDRINCFEKKNTVIPVINSLVFCLKFQHIQIVLIPSILLEGTMSN